MDIFFETGNQKFLIFLYDGRGKYGASFEYGSIFGKNLNAGLIRDWIGIKHFLGVF